MRTVEVELQPEAIEPSLVCFDGRSRWRRSLAFERQVHALVPAVLLRFSRLDSLELDTKLEAPKSRAVTHGPDDQSG